MGHTTSASVTGKKNELDTFVRAEHCSSTSYFIVYIGGAVHGMADLVWWYSVES